MINMVVISTIYASGIVGLLFSRDIISFGPTKTIDHKYRPVRYFYRYSMWGFCFFFSFLLSPALVLQFLPQVDLRSEPEYVQSAFALAYPTPLGMVFYFLLSKFARSAWWGRR